MKFIETDEVYFR